REPARAPPLPYTTLFRSAPEGPGTGGADRAGPGAAMAARPAGGGTAQGGGRMGRAVPALLGGELRPAGRVPGGAPGARKGGGRRSEEHTSELQSPDHIVC